MIVELNKLHCPPEIKHDALGEWFLESLRNIAGSFAIYNMTECFDNYAQTSGLMLFLDGLDEVFSKDYELVEEAILQLSSHLARLLENNIIILTMRSQFHQYVQRNYASWFPVILTIRPFTPTDICQFLTLWPFKADVLSQAGRLYDQLSDHPTLRDMCTNPLVLSMYVAEDQASGALIVPESRTQFYARVVEELLIRRRAKQVGVDAGVTKLREQRFKILGKIAFANLIDGTASANSLDWAGAVAAVCATIRCEHEEAGTFLRHLSKDTGLFTEERIGESLRFTHRAFCEFFVAHYAVDSLERGWSILIERHVQARTQHDPASRSRLVETIPFAAGLLPSRMKSVALRDVFASGDHRLVARVLLETKSYDDPLWIEFERDEKRRLLALADNGERDWLEDVYLFSTVTIDAGRCSPPVANEQLLWDLDKFYTTLAARSGEHMRILIEAYALRDAAAAFRIADLCRLDVVDDLPHLVVSHTDQPRFLTLCCQQAAKEPHRSAAWATLLAEAALRSKAVARSLRALAPIAEWEEQIESLPKANRWGSRTFIEPCLLTDCFTLSTFNTDVAVYDTPVVNALRSMPAVAKAGLGRGRALCYMAIVLFGLMGVVTEAVVRERSGGMQVLTGVTLILLASSAYVGTFRWAVRRRIYRRLFFAGEANFEPGKAIITELLPLHLQPITDLLSARPTISGETSHIWRILLGDRIYRGYMSVLHAKRMLGAGAVPSAVLREDAR